MKVLARSLAAVVLFPSLSFAQAPLASTLEASGLRWPVYATHAPGDETRLFIVEQGGLVRILDLASKTILPAPFLDLDARLDNVTGEFQAHGLMCLAFDPDYATNGFVYVSMVWQQHTVVSRFTVSANPDLIDPTTEVFVMAFPEPGPDHNGDWLGFSPVDGYLYITAGDGGEGQCDPGQRAQDITRERHGKILRVDPSGDDFPFDHRRNYAIPPTNPFVGQLPDDEIWAYGLRNPWRASFDRQTGDFYVADVGQDDREEIDYEPVGFPGGANYGWDCREGTVCSSVSAGCAGQPSGCSCPGPSLVDPLFEYGHDCATGGFSITGGYVYRGCAIPFMQGWYLYGDYICANIWALGHDGSHVQAVRDLTAVLSPSIEGQTIERVVSFVEDARGELYVLDRGTGSNGQLFKIVPTGPPASCP